VCIGLIVTVLSLCSVHLNSILCTPRVYVTIAIECSSVFMVMAVIFSVYCSSFSGLCCWIYINEYL